jgi:aldehyde:ferredoxin oxidoreductase
MILRVNLTRETISHDQDCAYPIDLGGRALTSSIVAKEVPPHSTPLGNDNRLVLAPGILTGSALSSADRLSIGGKSPLTGGIKESNVGGKAGAALARLGIRALIICGVAKEWHILHLSPGKCEILPAGSLVGKNIFPTVRDLQRKFGADTAMMVIGSAGEHRMAAAAIGVTDVDGVPARHAARGGLGAVMGAMKLKAIVLDLKGTDLVPGADVDGLRRASKRYARALLSNNTTGRVLTEYGTAVLVNIIDNAGGLPTRDFRVGNFEGADAISGEWMHDTINARSGKNVHPCMPGCVIRCSNVYPSATGVEITRGLEYESIAMLGSNCGISDLDAIAQANRLCDDIGLDTIEVGASLAVAMDAGIAPFGNAQAMQEMIGEIGQGTALGRVLGQGAVITGRVFGAARIPAVKGQAIAAYDPRALKGTGVTYATSPMGADHTAGNAIPGTVLPGIGMIDPAKADHQIAMSRYLQELAAFFDAAGLCWFARAPLLEEHDLLLDMMVTRLGRGFEWTDLMEIGWRTLQIEREFNSRCGFNSFDDRLPSFFLDEPLPPRQLTFDVKNEALDTVLTQHDQIADARKPDYASD